MSIKKGIFAFEELREQADDSLDLDNEISDDIIASTSDSAAITELVDASNEGTEVADTLEQMEAADSPEEAVKIATEHLLNRVGYKHTSVISLEDFATGLNKNLSLAQEGIISRIGNGIKRTLTTRRKALTKLEDALKRLEKRGSKESDLVDPAWSKYLIANASKRVTASDVLSFVTKLSNIVNSKETIEYFNTAAAQLDKIAAELNKGRFIADSAATQAIRDLQEEVDAAATKYNSYFHNEVTNHVDRYPDFEPIGISDAKKLAKLITPYIDKTNESSVDKLMNHIVRFNENLDQNYIVRLGGEHASDIRAARMATTTINQTLAKINSIYSRQFAVAYACIRYIESSVQ